MKSNRSGQPAGSVIPEAIKDLARLLKVLREVVGGSNPYMWEVIDIPSGKKAQTSGVIFKVVSPEGAQLINTEEELIKKYGPQTGVTKAGPLRRELVGLPKFKRLLGPMFDGYNQGRVVVRYESQEAYDFYST